jgi:hypothetical protein
MRVQSQNDEFDRAVRDFWGVVDASKLVVSADSAVLSVLTQLLQRPQPLESLETILANYCMGFFFPSHIVAVA